MTGNVQIARGPEPRSSCGIGHGDAHGRDRAGQPLVRGEAGAQGRQHVHPEAPDHGLHRALRLREEHAPPVPEPDERSGGRSACHRPHPDRRDRHSRSAARRDRPPQARGHGVSEVEPIPEVHLRERRLRPAHPGCQQPRGSRGDGGAEPQGQRRCGTRSPTGCTRVRSASRADSSSASASLARSPSSRTSFSWTSRAPRSTPSPPRRSRS